MRKRRIGQTAEIDYVGTLLAIGLGATQDALHRQVRRLDDLGEYAHIITGQVRRLAAATEILRQIFQILGAALDRDSVLRFQFGQISATQAGQHHPVGITGIRQPAQYQFRRHQRRDRNTDLRDAVLEILWMFVVSLNIRQHLVQAFFGELAGQEEEIFRHAKRSWMAVCSSCMSPTTVVSSKVLRVSMFCRSIRRG